MSSPSDDDKRARLISEAVELALTVSKQGSSTLSAFLTDVTPEAANAARMAAHHMRSSGKLTNDALTVALDVADAAKEGLPEDSDTRGRAVDMMSQLVSFFGSMFIDTANKAVGTSAGQPATNRARLVSVEVPPAGRAGVPLVGQPASVWVVNRGDVTVSNAKVSVINPSSTLRFEWEPKTLTIRPRERVKIVLTIADLGSAIGSFTDALLVVDQVGSTVIRTKVESAEGRPTPTSP